MTDTELNDEIMELTDDWDWPLDHYEGSEYCMNITLTRLSLRWINENYDELSTEMVVYLKRQIGSLRGSLSSNSITKDGKNSVKSKILKCKRIKQILENDNLEKTPEDYSRMIIELKRSEPYVTSNFIEIIDKDNHIRELKDRLDNIRELLE